MIKSSVVRECIKERLLTLSTAVTGPNPWEENSEFSMQKVCWGTIPGSTTGRERRIQMGQRSSVISHEGDTAGPRELWSRSDPGQGQSTFATLLSTNPSCTVPLEWGMALKEMAFLH